MGVGNKGKSENKREGRWATLKSRNCARSGERRLGSKEDSVEILGSPEGSGQKAGPG